MNDFMGSPSEFYEFLKVESTRLRKVITTAQRLAEANPGRDVYHDQVMDLVQQRHDIELFIAQRPRTIRPYQLKDSDYILKREYLYGVMTGEAEPFFKHMRNELIEWHVGLTDLRERICECRSAQQLYGLEEVLAKQYPMYTDLFRWMVANDPMK